MIERTNHRSKITRTVALLLLASMVIAACTVGDDGIFATIALERRSTTRNLNDNALILGIVQTENNQVLALVGNQVFQRDLSSNTWSGISTPSVSGGQWRPIGLVGLDTNATNGTGVTEEHYIHASFDTTDSSAAARTVVFRMSGTSFGSIVLDSASAASPVETIGGMEAIEDHLVVSTEDSSGTYLLYSFNNGFTADDWAGLGADSHAFPLEGAVSSGQDIVDSDVSSNAAVFVGESGGLFRLASADLGSGGSADPPLQLVDLPLHGSGPGPRPYGVDFGTGIAVSGTSPATVNLWIVADGSRDTGRIFVNETADASGTWDEVDTEASLSFSDALWVGGTHEALLVGTFTSVTATTSADGLRIVNLTRSGFNLYDGTLSDDLGRSYEAVELSDAAIRSLDLIQTTLYAQTSGSGLWSVPLFAETTPDNREWIWE